MKKIDCHTHIVNSKIRDEYFATTDGYALIMEFLPKFEGGGIVDDSFAVAMSDKRLFLCPVVDISRDITKQLKEIAAAMESYPIVGLKIYLTYQKGRANDEKMLPIYEFAKENNLSVTFHTGSCALTLPSDNDLEGSDAKYVEQVANKFPSVNFIVAHMDDPRYDECIKIVARTPNMFTDFSGAYEPGTPEGDSIDWAIETFKRAINQFPDTYKKILYGTDFCPPINLSAISEYDETIKKIFRPEQFEDIYYNNCLRAFPRLADLIKGE